MVAFRFVVVGNRERVKEDRPSCLEARAKAEIIVFGFDGFQIALQGICSTYCITNGRISSRHGLLHVGRAREAYRLGVIQLS